jgi:DNA repair exonuclease SbcCD nuclease subunit
VKIAITADIHLKTDREYPERFNALKNILDQLVDEGIRDLIIAGDLFDINSQNYSLFDELCKEEKYRGIDFYLIPGNHDSSITSKYFTADNIKIFDKPSFQTFGDSGCIFFFIPYLTGKSMGETIAKYREDLEGQWILIGHGDYLAGVKDPNTYEKGVYMPLGRSDIEYYAPLMVILGHIHKKVEAGRVYYPGSPCSMDINETGRRRFIILDLGDMSISERTVNTDYIFLNEKLIVLPTENEFDDIENKIAGLIESLNLSGEETAKVRLRLKVKGYTSNRKKLKDILMESLSDFSFYNDEEPDISEVSLFDDPERTGIVGRVKEKIDSLQEDCGYSQEKKNMILEQALGIILKE